jgi:Glycosyltransferase like family 2
VTTVIIPAHNEGRVIGRLLRQLMPGAAEAGINVIVVANGCSDNTAEVAASFGPNLEVVCIPVASKFEALAAGNRAAPDHPRVYVDADVELRARDVQELEAVLRQHGILAAAPELVLDQTGVPWPVRWYCAVWMRLPEVRRGLFGRGVIAVAEPGQERLAHLPPLLGDDLAVSLSFAPHERAIAGEARVVVHPPRAFADLLRRRVRVVVGGAQMEHAEEVAGTAARTRMPHLLAIARREPRMAPRVALFLAVAVVARLQATRKLARRDYSTWMRDESSRRAEDAGHGGEGQPGHR